MINKQLEQRAEEAMLRIMGNVLPQMPVPEYGNFIGLIMVPLPGGMYIGIGEKRNICYQYVQEDNSFKYAIFDKGI